MQVISVLEMIKVELTVATAFLSKNTNMCLLASGQYSCHNQNTAIYRHPSGSRPLQSNIPGFLTVYFRADLVMISSQNYTGFLSGQRQGHQTLTLQGLSSLIYEDMGELAM